MLISRWTSPKSLGRLFAFFVPIGGGFVCIDATQGVHAGRSKGRSRSSSSSSSSGVGWAPRQGVNALFSFAMERISFHVIPEFSFERLNSMGLSLIMLSHTVEMGCRGWERVYSRVACPRRLAVDYAFPSRRRGSSKLHNRLAPIRAHTQATSCRPLSPVSPTMYMSSLSGWKLYARP